MIKTFQQFINESTLTANKEALDIYILNAIDADNYDVVLKSDKDKLQFLFDTFKSEYHKEKNVKGFEDWIRGLPSSFNIDYDFEKIINLSYMFDLMKADADEEDEDYIQNNWFKIIAKEVYQLFDEYGTDESLSESLNETNYTEQDGKKYFVWFDTDGWDSFEKAEDSIDALINGANDPLSDDVDSLADDDKVEIDWDVKPIKLPGKDNFIGVQFYLK